MFDPISLGLGYAAWKLGKSFFAGSNKPSPRPNPRKEAEIKELSAEPIFFAVAILAKFAKADGVVTKNEVATIEEILCDIELTGEDRKKAISIFAKHKKGAISYKQGVSILAELTADSPEFRSGLCILLLRLAHADGTPPESAIRRVRQACSAFGIDYREVHEIFQQQERGRRKPVNADFAVLGCSPNDSVDTIKKRYRELTKIYHPDTISGKDVRPEVTQLMAAKFREIQEAYELIMSHHNASAASRNTRTDSAEDPSSSDLCPKCGKPLGAGVTRCWSRGCGYVVPEK